MLNEFPMRGRTCLLLTLGLFAVGVLRPPQASGQGTIGILSAEQQCEDGDLQACEREGAEKSQPPDDSLFGGGTYDPARAVKAYQRACKGGRMGACAGLGSMYLKGRGVPKDSRRAAMLYQKACDGGFAQACTWLGGLYRSGEGVKADPKKARALWQRACDAKDGQGCSSLGQAHELGIGGAVDLAAAVSAREKACGLGDGDACVLASNHYLQGQGVEKNPEKAEAYLRRGRELNAVPVR